MPEIITSNECLWGSVITVLAVNFLVMFLLFFYHTPFLRKIAHPFIITTFLLESVCDSYFYSLGYSLLISTDTMISVLAFILLMIVEIFLSKDKKLVKNGYDKNESSSNSGFDYLTLIFAATIILSQALEGAMIHHFENSIYKYVSTIFRYIFIYGTREFFVGLYIINQNLPNWYYFLYMFLLAAVWSIASVASYFANQSNLSSIQLSYSFFNDLKRGTFLYIFFKLFEHIPQYFQNENKNLFCHLCLIIISLLYYAFITQINY